MHGLIFETSIWLLAGSTRFVMITQVLPVRQVGHDLTICELLSYQQAPSPWGLCLRNFLHHLSNPQQIVNYIAMCKSTFRTKPTFWLCPRASIKRSTRCPTYALTLLKTHPVIKQCNDIRPAKQHCPTMPFRSECHPIFNCLNFQVDSQSIMEISTWFTIYQGCLSTHLDLPTYSTTLNEVQCDFQCVFAVVSHLSCCRRFCEKFAFIKCWDSTNVVNH